MTKKISLTIFAILLAAAAYAQTADQIIKKADEAFTLDKIYSKSTLTVVRNGKELVPQTMEGYDSDAADGTARSLSVFIAPARVAGTAYLTIGNDLWVRFASTGRVRKMSSSARKNSAAGSDFSFADMGEGSKSFTDDYTASLNGSEKIDGAECWKIILIPKKKDANYEKMVAWITKDSDKYVQIEYYEDGAAIKRMTLDDYRSVSGTIYPFRITMKSLVEDSVSTITTEALEANSDKVQERFFNNAYLRTIR